MPNASRILLVEDDPGLLDLVARYLARIGYRVRACSTGTEAREALSSGETFDLALLDLALPDITGQELARDLLAGGVQANRIVLMSGFTLDTLAPDLRDRVGFLQKPFTPLTLAATITDALR